MEIYYEQRILGSVDRSSTWVGCYCTAAASVGAKTELRAWAAAGAGAEQLEKLFAKLAGASSKIATLTALASRGRQMETGDLISAYRSLAKQLKAAGVKQIGEVGEVRRRRFLEYAASSSLVSVRVWFLGAGCMD